MDRLRSLFQDIDVESNTSLQVRPRKITNYRSTPNDSAVVGLELVSTNSHRLLYPSDSISGLLLALSDAGTAEWE